MKLLHSIPLATALALAQACAEAEPPVDNPPADNPQAASEGAAPSLPEPQHTPRTAPPWSAPSDPALGASCEDCHTDLVRDYRRTGMARALSPVFPEEFEGLGRIDDGAGFRYRVATNERGRPTLVETHPATAALRVEAPLVFAIGAGIVDRSYAARLGEFLWFAPLEVASGAPGARRHAALAPGHAMQPGTRFAGPVTPECLGCHTDRPPPTNFPLNLRPPATWRPTGIGCGTCHGSVDAHRGWQEADLSGEEPGGEDPILRHAGLSREARMSVCAACHLQGDARIALEPGRLGPPPPGGDLLEQRAIFVAAEPTAEIGFVSQVQRLVLSPCYRASPAMDCNSCHDPHRSLERPGERERVRAGCLECHPAGHGMRAASSRPAPACSTERATRLGADCASCHMRRTPVFDVEGVTITDHRVVRRPQPPSPARAGLAPTGLTLRFDESANGAWRRFAWPGRPAPEHGSDPGLRAVALYHRGHVAEALALVDEPVHPRVQALPMYHHVRGSMLEAAGRPADAARAYESALALAPELGPAAVNLGLLLGSLGRTPDGLAVLDGVLARYPRAVSALRNRAVLKNAQGDLAGLALDLEEAFHLMPRPELANALAGVHAARGNAAAAANWRAAVQLLSGP